MSATILVVDDSATVRQQVSAAVTQAGFKVIEARDGVEGKARIEAGGIDCVICDVNMPNKNGIEMVEEVKANPRYAKLPIVMLTTEGAKELITRAKTAGASGWIVKPFKANLLVAAVEKLTSKPAAV
jgi:two-component system, chemotaxis family, chemotaxis protein CheY